MSSIMREDWIEVELGEVCDKAETVKRKDMIHSAIFKYFDIGGINNKINRIVSFKEYSWENAPSRAQQIIKKGDVLFSTVRTYLKNIAQVDKEDYDNQICSSGFTVIRGINETIIPNYIFYYSFSVGFLNPLSALQTGSSYPAVRDKDVFSQIFPLAPLPIQRAIVSKIEALFSDLDNGIANFKKAQEQLKIYRQAVLKKAFEGGFSITNSITNYELEITNEENQSNQSNQKNHSSDNLPKGWKWVKMGEIIEKIEAGKSFRCQERPPQNDEVGVLKVSAVTWEEFSELESKTIISDDKVNQSYFVKQGDFLFSRANTLELVGRSVIVKNIHKKLMLSDKTLRFKFSAPVNPVYILYFLRTQNGRKQIESLSTGNQISMRNIGQSRIKQISFPFCSLQEQTQIVQEIESRLSVTDNLEFVIRNSIEKAEALRQSILKKAFEGKLLSQAEIELCKKETDYEPASELLKKIQAEKAERIRNEKLRITNAKKSKK